MSRLPAPDPQTLADSRALEARIRAEIEAAGGALSFRRYMEMALYDPQYGYYTGGLAKFGPGGDFITAPELGPVFGRCLARQVAEVLNTLGGGDVLEFGGGSGVLAVELLGALRDLDCLPERYLLLEPSPVLRARQRERIGSALPELAGRVVWLEHLPERLQGVVVANEVLDAMPVRRFGISGDGPFELGVGVGDGGFEDRVLPADEELIAWLNDTGLDGLPPGFVSEWNPVLAGWVKALGALLEQGVAFICDYGWSRAEYYHPQHAEGTLVCHYRHHVHDDPYFLPGGQDITASVDFTAVAEAATQAGLEVLGYTLQNAFLIGSGLETVHAGLAKDADPAQAAQLSAEIQKLMLPGQMGERFRVMALGQCYDAPLCGFSWQDHRHRL
ncbi:MAG: SAM-dependent methyltransferase [Gammaproteobacteria bacterium]|nr:MAG: SAM-dependent methyltransferase [Gammaproteobacteria bacterium]